MVIQQLYEFKISLWKKHPSFSLLFLAYWKISDIHWRKYCCNSELALMQQVQSQAMPTSVKTICSTGYRPQRDTNLEWSDNIATNMATSGYTFQALMFFRSNKGRKGWSKVGCFKQRRSQEAFCSGNAKLRFLVPESHQWYQMEPRMESVV